ncbi:MAG: HAD hydrolase-like protein [Candidatus Rokubacteria bacterium]|nr:HAD hydrolase-like protein [Candidatus Rokubacteria bacterium]MBI3827592.1 HAD hydrolase-like protein [Candidatus Rokubacteria bacterium]
MGLCVFDLDHTLVRTPLDLAAMAAEMRRRLEARCGPLPPRQERYRIGELLAHCRAHAPALEADLWRLALEREHRAMEQATLEAGALEAVAGTRAAGFRTAVWTNNAREVSLPALARLGLLEHLDLVVTRDDMRALKPDPDGWRVIAAHFGEVGVAVVVGDSWVDGVAAAAVGVPFVAYRPRPGEMDRFKVTPVAWTDDLATLPAWLVTRWSGAP